MEQSTRELSMLGPETQEAASESSSRVSTPAPGSCEDIGGSGLELEELNSLEKKIKRLEKAEAAAVEKVKLLETETLKLRENFEDSHYKLDEPRTSLRLLTLS